MTEEQKKYLNEWINCLVFRSEILETEIKEIEKRKNTSKISKNIMIDVRKELIEKNNKQLELLNILKEANND